MAALALAPSLDTAAAAALRVELLARLDAREPLVLDASAVSRVGQACLQVLASARISAADAGLPFAVAAASEPFVEMAALAGLDALLGAEG